MIVYLIRNVMDHTRDYVGCSSSKDLDHVWHDLIADAFLFNVRSPLCAAIRRCGEHSFEGTVLAKFADEVSATNEMNAWLVGDRVMTCEQDSSLRQCTAASVTSIVV